VAAGEQQDQALEEGQEWVGGRKGSSAMQRIVIRERKRILRVKKRRRGGMRRSRVPGQ
jgi:hypothetical protein